MKNENDIAPSVTSEEGDRAGLGWKKSTGDERSDGWMWDIKWMKSIVDRVRAAGSDISCDVLNDVLAILHRDQINRVAALARQQQAAPAAVTVAPDWPACNEGCEYEDPYGGMHDCRSLDCSCAAAKASIARQTAAPVVTDAARDVLTVQEFKEWLNERRMCDVSLVFHEVVARYRTALQTQSKE